MAALDSRMYTLRSPYLAEIFTDQPIYSPGQQVTGQVMFTLKRKLMFDKLIATMRGEVSVAFELKPDTKEMLGYRQPNVPPTTIEYKNRRQLLSQSIVLWTKDQNIKKVIRRALQSGFDSDIDCELGLEPGTYVYHFAFQLPTSGLYTSFSSTPAKVRYVIEVATQYGDAEITRGESLVAVVCPEILTINRSPAIGNQSFVRTARISGTEQLTVQLVLNQTMFLPGDAIQGEIIIHNKTKQSIKYSHLNIAHKLFCFAETPSFCQFNHEIREQGIGLAGDKVRAGNSFSYPIHLNIPALIPQLNIPDCIYSAYELQLAVGFARNSPNAAVINMSVPIKIGTELVEVFDSNLSVAPPAYEEISVK